MATYNMCRNLSVQVAVTNGVAAALYCRFATWKGAGAAQREVVTHVPGAAGAPAVGIVAMRADVKGQPNGLAETSIVVPDGCVAIIELGEAVTVPGAKLRVGGNGAEVDGRAYLADATGDYIVGTALETGAIGEQIAFQFLNMGLLP